VSGQTAEVIVAGHICLDVIPEIPKLQGGLAELMVPGKLAAVGPALLSTGGAVSNTGLALHRLGFQTQLMGKIGDDLFGKAIVDVISSHGGALTDGMIASPGETSSYTIVISPPGVDRVFLHATGANDTFCADDVRLEALAGTRLFHFGYPPLMRRMFENGGEELVRILSGVKSQGLTVSLDMAKPDPASPAGRADWRDILSRVLPHVDVFLPSFEEILFMLRPALYEQMTQQHGTEELLAYADGELLSSLSGELLELGVTIAGLKLGEYGLYIRTTNDAGKLAAMGACAPADADNWRNRELLAPCFAVKVAGTTGAGDCTIAGFLGGLLKGLDVERALLSAVGTGACNVEGADAVSGLRPWPEVQRRMEAGWSQRESLRGLDGWHTLDVNGNTLYEKS